MARYKFVVYDYYKNQLGDVVGEALRFQDAWNIKDNYNKSVYYECDTEIKKIKLPTTVSTKESANND